MPPRSSKTNVPAKTPAPPRRGAAARSSVARPSFLSDGDEASRLQKFLASAGVDSRRNCEEFVRTGRVTVDGEVVKDPAFAVNSEQHDVRLDGERLRLPRFKYFLLNKPKGVVCTNNDPAGRPRAIDLIPGGEKRLFTVGRLDENTQGLLLVTNDGALAEHLAHPRYEVARRYRVQVAGIPTLETLGELKQGMYFSDGFFRFQNVKLLKRKGRSVFLELELREGKNREIRRLLARAGHKVIHLERIAFGPLRVGDLEIGRSRELKPSELKELYSFIESTPHERAAKEVGRRRPTKPRVTGTKKKTPRRASTREPTEVGRRGAARNAPAPRPSTRGKKTSVKGRPSGKTKGSGRPKGTGKPKGAGKTGGRIRKK